MTKLFLDRTVSQVGVPGKGKGFGAQQDTGFISSAMRCELSGPGEIPLA